MNSLAVKIWCSLLLVAVAAYGGWTWWKWQQASQAAASAGGDGEAYQLVIQDGPPLEEFTLTERTGREFDSADMQGRVWIASFFFTSCPGECLTLNRRIAELHEKWAERELTFVSITCDPETDTPAALTTYADHFKADAERWLFLTGDKALIHRIARDVFKTAIATKTHTDRMFLIDRDGKMLGTYRATQDADMVALERKLDELLAGDEVAQRAAAAGTDRS